MPRPPARTASRLPGIILAEGPGSNSESVRKHERQRARAATVSRRVHFYSAGAAEFY
jgi:hypothetical protein